MRTTSIHAIVKSVLGQKRLSIHYYSRFLKFAADGYREIRFDSLYAINTVRLSIDDNGVANIPEDCVDASSIRCGVQVGQFVRPLVKRASINRLSNINSETGAVIPYENLEDLSDSDFGLSFVGSGSVHYNDNGENIGGYYGIGAGEESDTYSIIEERNEIQFHQSIENVVPVCMYLSDGSFVNAASKITPLAQKCIEEYIDWQYKHHSKSFGLGDARDAEDRFNKAHSRLRSRKNDLTPEQVERIINRSRKATIK